MPGVVGAPGISILWKLKKSAQFLVEEGARMVSSIQEGHLLGWKYNT